MRNKFAAVFLYLITFFLGIPRLLADSVNSIVETHTSTSATRTTTYTILGMDQTTGVIVIAAAVIILLLIIMIASRSTTKTETTIVK